MREMASRLMGRKWDETTGSLDFSCQEITFSLPPETQKEGSFHVTGPNGELTEGFVSSTDRHMQCLTPWFSGVLDEIGYRFDSSGLREGESVCGNFLILSNQGEYEIPYRITVMPRSLDSSLGNVRNLFHFANLAKCNWAEAVALFYRPDFIRILENSDDNYRKIYEGLSHMPGNEQNVEEFLLVIHKKEKIQYLTDKTKFTAEQTQDKQAVELTITRNGWGYTRLLVETEGGFLASSKNLLTDLDFQDNVCHLTLLLNKERLHAGCNFGCVTLVSPYESLRIPVQMNCRAGRRPTANLRKEQKQLVLQLTNIYLDYRMKRLQTSAWLAKTRQVVERMNAVDDKNPAGRLFQAHILITEERNKEARWILDHVQMLLKEESPALHCYYLYLTTLINREESYVAEVARQIRDIFRFYHSDWRIAWLLLYLSEELNRSVTKKWLFLEEQFTRSCTSPVMYIEALQLMNANPTLLMKLGAYEVQLLHFGARRELLTKELAEHFYYLAAREKNCQDTVLKVLYLCYGKKPSPSCLQAICTLLIKGNRTGSAYVKWYRLGVEQELRITRLYEYYMMSVDLDAQEDIPKIALLYFAYRSSLEPEYNAYLYSYVLKHREEYPDLYAAYAPQIERFVIKELYRGSMSRHMAYLYRHVLTKDLLTPDNLQALAPLLFLHEVRCAKEKLTKVAVLHEHMQREETYPLTEGRAYVPLYDKEDALLLEDEDGNRYAVSEEKEIKKLMFPRQVLEQKPDMAGEDLGVNLYLCHDIRNSRIREENAQRYRFLAQSEAMEPAVRQFLQLQLIQFYYQQDMICELDTYLEALQYDSVEDGSRPEMVRFMVFRGMYPKAYQWVTLMGPDQVDAKILVRLCSRMLEKENTVEDARLLEVAFSAFIRGKYDTSLLEYLVRFYEGSTRGMKEIWRAAESFVLDTYPICSRLLIQILYTGGSLGEDAEAIFKTYVNGGAKTEIERAYLDRCAHDYLLRDVPLEAYVLKDILRCFKRKEMLGTACGLAVMRYFADKPQEQDADVRQMLLLCARQLLQAGIQMPFFARYADLLPQMKVFLDRTMVTYRDPARKSVLIHYRRQGSQEPFARDEMRNMYGGIFVRSFVLFFGEKLEYFITEAKDEAQEPLASGVLEKEEMGPGSTSRYGRLNEMVRLQAFGRQDETVELLEEYTHLDYMVEQLFTPV